MLSNCCALGGCGLPTKLANSSSSLATGPTTHNTIPTHTRARAQVPSGCPFCDVGQRVASRQTTTTPRARGATTGGVLVGHRRRSRCVLAPLWAGSVCWRAIVAGRSRPDLGGASGRPPGAGWCTNCTNCSSVSGSPARRRAARAHTHARSKTGLALAGLAQLRAATQLN